MSSRSSLRYWVFVPANENESAGVASNLQSSNALARLTLNQR